MAWNYGEMYGRAANVLGFLDTRSDIVDLSHGEKLSLVAGNSVIPKDGIDPIAFSRKLLLMKNPRKIEQINVLSEVHKALLELDLMGA
jgi:hypothetical protein